MEINTHDLFITFGKHQGERWTRLPISYLHWIINETNGEAKLIALAELKRRGTTMRTDLDLSGHAIDRASQITKDWKRYGVYSWLTTIANEALKRGNGEEEVIYKNYKFIFIYGEHYPTLKTIMIKK